MASKRIYRACTAAFGPDADSDELLVCVLEKMDEKTTDSQRVLLVFCAMLVFFMQAGFAMVCAGSVRRKNVCNTMLKNFLDACGAALGFFTIGYAFAFGGTDPTSSSKTFIGHTNFFMIGVEDHAAWLFQFSLSSASATLVAGTVAERCQMAAYLCYSLALTGFVYPVAAHSLWSAQGFLSPYGLDPLWGTGAIDFSGSGVVHVTGGLTALIAAKALGPRRGRFFGDEGEVLPAPKPIPGHSIALQVLGTFILWFGWYGFNPGTALLVGGTSFSKVAGLCAVNTTMAAASSGTVALFLNLFVIERQTGEALFDIVILANGALAGLVSITSGCAVVEPWAAVLIGAVAGAVFLVTSKFLVMLRIDDAVDAIPVHCASGTWGVLATGLLANKERLLAAYGRAEHIGWLYNLSDGTLLAMQTIELLFIYGWVGMTMYPFFKLLNYLGWLRADSLEELVGLDYSYHGTGVLMPEEVASSDAFEEYRQRQENNGRRKRFPKVKNESLLVIDEDLEVDYNEPELVPQPEPDPIRTVARGIIGEEPTDLLW